MQIASTTVNPWLDMEHRRYWVAKLDCKIVGILVLTPLHHGHWLIANVVPFTSSPKGTSEALIHTVLKDIEAEQGIVHDSNGSLNPSENAEILIPYPPSDLKLEANIIARPGLVSFGISATPDVEFVHNPSTKLETIVKIYNKVVYLGGPFGRKEFRSKFDPIHNSMYVCHPPDVFDKCSRLSLLEHLINALRTS